MSRGTQGKPATLAAIREFVRDCFARRWPGRAAEIVRRQPARTEPPHAWREWRRDIVDGRPIKLDVCKACDGVRVQDNRRRRSESSYVRWVRRTLFYMPGPAGRREAG